VCHFKVSSVSAPMSLDHAIVVSHPDFGVERSVSLASLSENDVDAQLAALVAGGRDLPKSAESQTKFVDIL
jgi:hypothetical protein